MKTFAAGQQAHPRYTASSRRSSQEGSAYIVTLMVLFVLTILGISLTLVTQTEMLVGSQERKIQRLFYAADSGIGVATAQVLVTKDHTARTFQITESSERVGSDVLRITDQVEMSPFVPILDAPCNLCQINQGNQFFEITHAVSVVATRRGMHGSNTAAPLGREAVSVMVDLQPWQLSTEVLSDTLANSSGFQSP